MELARDARSSGFAAADEVFVSENGMLPAHVLDALAAEVYAERTAARAEENLGAVCARIVDLGHAMRDVLDEQRTARAALLRAVYLAVGEDMLNRAQRTKTVHAGGRSFIVEVGCDPIRYCACHAALPSECPSVGAIEILQTGAEPWINVREASATSEAA